MYLGSVVVPPTSSTFVTAHLFVSVASLLVASFSPLPHYLEKVSHRFRYKIQSLLPRQLDNQSVIESKSFELLRDLIFSF